MYSWELHFYSPEFHRSLDVHIRAKTRQRALSIFMEGLGSRWITDIDTDALLYHSWDLRAKYDDNRN